MVLSERNSELVRNGRRSRGPSPNGHNSNSNTFLSLSGGSAVNAPSVMSNIVGGGGTPDTSSDDDNSMKQKNGIRNKNSKSEYEEKIRVGRDYQAVCPPFATDSERGKLEGSADRALLVWKPTKDIPDNKLEEYISVAKEKYGYNGEQALGMLFWHKHDLERAVMDLANFTPFPDEWTVEDKVLFEQAFQFHGKSFHRIRQMLPDKSIASLVKYYYSWKKTRHRQSTMDRQEKSKGSKEGSENGSENGSNEDSDNDDKDQAAGILDSSKSPAAGGVDNDAADNSMANTENSIGNCVGACSGRTNCQGCDSGYCFNCGVYCNVLFQSPNGKLCDSCHHHWRRTGERRPISCPYKRLRNDRNTDNKTKRRPRGININHDDIITLATQDYGSHDNLMVSLEREIEKCHTRVQLNKALLSDQKKRLSECSEELRPSEPVSRINARWSNDECLLAVQGVRRYGKDFQTIAEIIGTKTEAHVRTFYVNHRRRYNLDQLLKTHETDKQAAAAASAAASATSEKIADEKTNATSSGDIVDVDAVADADGATTASSATTTSTTNNNKNKSDIELSAKKEETIETKTVEESLTDKNQDDNLIELKDSNNIDGLKATPLSTAINKSAANVVSVENSNAPKEIVEIDLDAEPLEPPAKKLALTVPNQSFPESKAASS